MLPTESGNDWECLPASCRDKGWTWRRVGALCLSWWLRPVGTRGGRGDGWGPCACPGGLTSGLGCVRPTGLLPTRTSTRPNTVQICAMARSILLILALPYTLRFSLFEQYWALCLSSLGCDLCAPRSPHWIALPPGPHPAPHPPLVPTGPHSVVNIHQDRGRHITGFGRQHSSG